MTKVCQGSKYPKKNGRVISAADSGSSMPAKSPVFPRVKNYFVLLAEAPTAHHFSTAPCQRIGKGEGHCQWPAATGKVNVVSALLAYFLTSPCSLFHPPLAQAMHDSSSSS